MAAMLLNFYITSAICFLVVGFGRAALIALLFSEVDDDE